MILCLAACSSSSVEETKGAVVKDNRFCVGYGREDITPNTPVGLTGYGNAGERIHKNVLDPLYLTCVATTDAEDNTVIMVVIDITGMDEAQLRDVCKQLGVETDETMGKGKLIDEIFGEKCEGNYIQPTFITDYPIEMSPLCKRHRENPELTERFELMVNGKELCNAYSELNDPIDQLERFQEQLRLSEKGDDEAMFIDNDFVRALEYGMPPTSGMGIGMDRLVMLMTGQQTIQEVLFFPQMRPEKKAPKDPVSKFVEIGIAEEWVPVIQKAGYNLVANMQGVNPQKVHMDICGINKKYKLDLKNPTVDEVAAWIERIG